MRAAHKISKIVTSPNVLKQSMKDLRGAISNFYVPEPQPSFKTVGLVPFAEMRAGAERTGRVWV